LTSLISVRNRIRSLKGVVFDLDGTLTLVKFKYNSPLHSTYVNRLKEGLVRLYGIPRDIIWESRFLSEIREKAVCYLEALGAPEAHLRRMLSFVDSLIDEYSSRELSSARLDPEAIHVLNALRSMALKIGLCTFSSRQVALRFLRRFNIIDFFDAIVTRTDVLHAKPNPLQLLTTIESLGLKPSNVMLVSDSLMDVAIGKSLGLACSVLITRESTIPYPVMCKPDIVIDRLGILVDLIRGARDGTP